jgi:hypothetical protein
MATNYVSLKDGVVVKTSAGPWVHHYAGDPITENADGDHLKTLLADKLIGKADTEDTAKAVAVERGLPGAEHGPDTGKKSAPGS